jgi:predicted  nucleic acid-binding Zn-ribbon protein
LAKLDAGPDEVHRQLQALQARLDALERDRAQGQQQAELLQQLVGEMRDLRAQIADADGRRRATEQDRAARQAQVQSAVSGLQNAQYRLMIGDGSVDAELDQAASAFSGPARRDVEAARRALQNRDLAQARAYLAAAISDAAQER